MARIDGVACAVARSDSGCRNNLATLQVLFGEGRPGRQKRTAAANERRTIRDEWRWPVAMSLISERRKVTIRAMADGDAPAVAEMARELAIALDDPEPRLDSSELVRDGMGADRWFECLVAVADSRAIGYAMFCRGYEAHIGKRRLWLSDLYVRPQARRLGAGRALMNAVAHQAATQGCDAVYWDLWRLNRAGQAFYESLGAVEIGDLAIWHMASRRPTRTSDSVP